MQKYFSQSFKGEEHGNTRGEIAGFPQEHGRMARKEGNWEAELETGSGGWLVRKLTKLKLPDASLALASSYAPSFLLLHTYSFFCTKLYTLLKSPQIFTGFRPHSTGAHPQVALFFPSGSKGSGLGWGKTAVIHPGSLWRKCGGTSNTMLL